MRVAAGIDYVFAAATTVALAFYLLPDLATELVQRTGRSMVRQAQVLPKGDGEPVAYIGTLVRADTFYTSDRATVELGDTLGANFYDPFRYLRIDLLDACHAAMPLASLEALIREDTVEVSMLGDAWRQELRSVISLLRKGPKSVAPQNYLPYSAQEERELMAAGVMGAEDAIREIEAKLRSIETSGLDRAHSSIEALYALLAEKRAYIDHARQKPSGASAAEAVIPTITPHLTAPQRARVLRLAAELRPVIRYVLAPVAGQFLAPKVGRVAQVRPMTKTSGDVVTVSDERAAHGAKDKPLYELEPAGTPVLWATAARVNASDGSGLTPAKRALLVRSSVTLLDTFEPRSATTIE